jgi:type I restriction enzyme R subunit
VDERSKEKTFETDVIKHLLTQGWIEGHSNGYDKAHALYPEDAVDWIRETQPDQWDKLNKDGNGVSKLIAAISRNLDKKGSLHVLRNVIKDVSIKLEMAQFRPGHNLNPQLEAKYARNRLRIVRQLYHSQHNKNSIDLVAFLNGIPVATFELKTDFKQTVEHAKRQYRTDRLPKDQKTGKPEPLLTFKRRALVYFAVSTDEVYMTTCLAGKSTYFLPFNKGRDGASGNPDNPNGYRTAYLWEDVMRKDTWMDILGRFIHLEDAGGKKERMIFPRFHQLDVVRKLIQSSKNEGPGNKYLIQHSAGSGKSNSIAWTAHRLANLHDDDNKKVFNSVLVITDRTVLDDQLQETIYQFDHKAGVVFGVSRKKQGDLGAKSKQLAQALIDGVPIVMVTIQTFPFVLQHIQKEVSLKERSFAVIVDEAHSSQTGNAANDVRRVLNIEKSEGDEEVTTEDLIDEVIASRSQADNISYYAFTATPKARTIELFGRRENPNLPAGPDNLPRPYHVYSMRQAIEEGFILDVLKNFLSYGTAFKMATEEGQAEVDQKQAKKQLMKWFRLHPHNIAQKVRVIVDHFREHISWQLEGKAKAMVVTGSRKEAVRYKIAMDKYIAEEKIKDVATLVAFSDEINDPESGPESFSEKNMNPGLKGRDIRDAFDTDDYQVLIVANKFQTGFDQPLLFAMYVDRPLGGVQMVQTYSRLNRCYPGKKEPFILDFVNSDEDVLNSFNPFYKTATLAGITDPNVVHDLQSKLDDERIYLVSEVEAFAVVFFDPKRKDQGSLTVHLQPAQDRFRDAWRSAEDNDDSKEKDRLKAFKKDLGSFIRAYEFLSQIVNYEDQDLEKRLAFYQHLMPLLRFDQEPEAVDTDAVSLSHYRLYKKGQVSVMLTGDGELDPGGEMGSGGGVEPKRGYLDEILEELNELFGAELTDADLVNAMERHTEAILANETILQEAWANPLNSFLLGSFKDVALDAIIQSDEAQMVIRDRLLDDKNLMDRYLKLMGQAVYDKAGQRRTAK